MVLDAAATFADSATNAGSDTAANTTGFSANDSYASSNSDAGSSSLHEAGSYSNGSWNLSSFVEQANATGSDTSTEAWSQSASGESATGTLTASDAGTYSLYRSGVYSNGSYSFASLSLDDSASGHETATEYGSNASFPSYSREDDYSYGYELQATGSGAVGTYTETSLETIAQHFRRRDGPQQ